MNKKKYKLTSVFISFLLANLALGNEKQSLDGYTRVMKEVQTLENEILMNGQKKAGPLTSIFTCVSATIAANSMSKMIENSYQQSLHKAFSEIPLGSRILEELEKRDPKIFDLNIDDTDYKEECLSKISEARQFSEITERNIAAVILLSEYGGQILSQYMSESLNP